MKSRILLTAYIVLVFSCSCIGPRHRNDVVSNLRDTVYVHRVKIDTLIMRDTITIGPEKIIIHKKNNYIPREKPVLDSMATQKVLEKSLESSIIELPQVDGTYPDLYYRKDLEYLPYLIMTFSKPYPLGWQQNCLFPLYKNLCCYTIDDSLLFKSWGDYVDVMNKQIDAEPPIVNPKNGRVRNRRWSYPDKAKHDEYGFGYGRFSKTVIDTLRVKALIYNDRKALTELEKYYRNKNYELGIAVYYKVMLGFEGNGDLAERLFRLLEPYLIKTSGYKRTVYEALTLAALRDHNKRAQELCDSLGFRMYEYGDSISQFYDFK